MGGTCKDEDSRKADSNNFEDARLELRNSNEKSKERSPSEAFTERTSQTCSSLRSPPFYQPDLKTSKIIALMNDRGNPKSKPYLTRYINRSYVSDEDKIFLAKFLSGPVDFLDNPNNEIDRLRAELSLDQFIGFELRRRRSGSICLWIDLEDRKNPSYVVRWDDCSKRPQLAPLTVRYVQDSESSFGEDVDGEDLTGGKGPVQENSAEESHSKKKGAEAKPGDSKSTDTEESADSEGSLSGDLNPDCSQASLTRIEELEAAIKALRSMLNSVLDINAEQLEKSHCFEERERALSGEFEAKIKKIREEAQEWKRRYEAKDVELTGRSALYIDSLSEVDDLKKEVRNLRKQLKDAVRPGQLVFNAFSSKLKDELAQTKAELCLSQKTIERLQKQAQYRHNLWNKGICLLGAQENEKLKNDYLTSMEKNRELVMEVASLKSQISNGNYAEFPPRKRIRVGESDPGMSQTLPLGYSSKESYLRYQDSTTTPEISQSPNQVSESSSQIGGKSHHDQRTRKPSFADDEHYSGIATQRQSRETIHVSSSLPSKGSGESAKERILAFPSSSVPSSSDPETNISLRLHQDRASESNPQANLLEATSGQRRPQSCMASSSSPLRASYNDPSNINPPLDSQVAPDSSSSEAQSTSQSFQFKAHTTTEIESQPFTQQPMTQFEQNQFSLG